MLSDEQIKEQTIGVFDSGIGGLSVANAIIELLPKESITYFGDTAHLPYGAKTPRQIIDYSFAITAFLLEKNCKAIVIACNTASAAALNPLRKAWPDIPFIGMEPAVKPAALITDSGKVGVLATQGTINSERYSDLTMRFARHLYLYEDPCIGLVELIETGKVDTSQTEALLNKILTPLLKKDIDTFVLGCTHYPFVKPLIQKIAGDKINIIDPAPAVARQTKTVLTKKALTSSSKINRTHHFYFSKNASSYHSILSKLFKGTPIKIHAFPPKKE